MSQFGDPGCIGTRYLLQNILWVLLESRTELSDVNKRSLGFICPKHLLAAPKWYPPSTQRSRTEIWHSIDRAHDSQQHQTSDARSKEGSENLTSEAIISAYSTAWSCINPQVVKRAFYFVVLVLSPSTLFSFRKIHFLVKRFRPLHEVQDTLQLCCRECISKRMGAAKWLFYRHLMAWL